MMFCTFTDILEAQERREKGSQDFLVPRCTQSDRGGRMPETRNAQAQRGADVPECGAFGDGIGDWGD